MGVSIKPEDPELWLLRSLRKLAVAPSDNTRVKAAAPKLPQSVVKALSDAESRGVISQPRGDTRYLETGGGFGTPGYDLGDAGYDFLNSRGAFAPNKPAGLLSDALELPGAVRGAAAGAKMAAQGHVLPGLLVAGVGALPVIGGKVGRGVARGVEHAVERDIARTAMRIPQAGERFAVLTAENAGGKAGTAEGNRLANAALKRDIEALGGEAVPVRGAYVDDQTGELLNENSFLVRGLSPKDAERLGRKYGQNSVLTDQGLHDLNSGKVWPSRGVNATKDVPYTELPGGERFVSDLDWDRQVPPVFDDPVVEALNKGEPLSKQANRGLLDMFGGSESDADALNQAVRRGTKFDNDLWSRLVGTHR